jgi:hypothetical protein
MCNEINTKELKIIYEKGFNLEKLENRDLIIAFLSLGIAIKSWFSTYSCQRFRIKWIDPDLIICTLRHLA